MRLNKEYHQNHSEQEREIRRRTFWACLQLDRMLAFYLVKPRTLSLRNISIALPGNDVSLAYGEKSRATTLESLQTFSGTISEIGLQPYLIKSLCLWSDLADFHVTQERMVSTLLPTNPSSRFAQLSSSLQSWENILPPRIQWSEENYRIHLDLDSGGVYLAIHCLLKSARCVSYQDYLPQTDGNSISLDYVDPAGWPLLHREPSLISICLSHALQMGEMIATHLTSDQDFKNQGQSTMIALSILSAASPLLWLQYSQGSHGFDNDRDRAGVYFENYIKLFRSWREAWAVAGIWLRQLEEMRALYRFAYLGAIEDEDSTPSPTNEPSIAVGYNSQSPEYRPSPGDGTPQANIPKSLYALLRLNRVATLDLRAEYQSSVWLTLMQGWPRSGDSDVWDDFPRNEVSYASVNW
ncbi:hypothetical protein N7462_006445 [Penicillium macrosclerotiorum]|uniref:uncharacterized protein n=1 Tax=Penicillium macrosclerotiorum TaxID=303699 RepID=UPI002548853E|nr:uncharacterized protein N7462_006445 [Penicillium macrosclerotiorum]KAJ5683280.1 hypothetical protein N7462_006445 [Penicillium macrosclerotiorum]